MEEEGFGIFIPKGEETYSDKQDLFFKPLPDALQEDDAILREAGQSLLEYSNAFCDIKGLARNLVEIARENHPGKENFPLALDQNLSQLSPLRKSRKKRDARKTND